VEQFGWRRPRAIERRVRVRALDEQAKPALWVRQSPEGEPTLAKQRLELKGLFDTYFEHAEWYVDFEASV
jgi:hypothetical protein